MYVNAEGGAPSIERRVRSHWAKVAGVVASGGVVSHKSALFGGPKDGMLVISHPTLTRRKVTLPGLTIEIRNGAGFLAGDMPLSQSGLHYSGRTRGLLENLGRKSSIRAGQEEVEHRLITTLNSSGEHALNAIRDEAVVLTQSLRLEAEAATLRRLIGELLGTHQRGELKTPEGIQVAIGKPVDKERIERFNLLADYLRAATLPRIEDTIPRGPSRHHAAFIESYFSNFVEGTKFAIEDARDIVIHNKIVESRPKDSHDILGVFRLAVEVPYRHSPPVAGDDFLPGLSEWHGQMLRMRPEAHPGTIKSQSNYAGTTEFVKPSHVRGTIEGGSRIALSIPEGFARAIFYAFLISEIHPFDDGNGRLSRLVMNAELSRVGLHRIIIPTLFHPQYIDCVRVLTRQNQPAEFVRSLAKMARWCAQFNYADLDLLLAQLKQSNALEESPARYQLLNVDGSRGLAG
ncbi:cell filamentation protein Fic [Pseudoduganella sp. FT55W]|uniref:Cell filamentation protein Fic n=1 Tax=Duganella rivi TaxID=2666083 RepID=A0A7X4KA52_9BURK|nr:cell filamentation protein Fic [Duganella rivi]